MGNLWELHGYAGRGMERDELVFKVVKHSHVCFVSVNVLILVVNCLYGG